MTFSPTARAAPKSSRTLAYVSLLAAALAFQRTPSFACAFSAAAPPIVQSHVNGSLRRNSASARSIGSTNSRAPRRSGSYYGSGAPPLTRMYEQTTLPGNVGPVSPATLSGLNLPPETCETGWSAQIVSRSAKNLEESDVVELSPMDSDHFVDRVSVKIPLPSVGLGIALREIAGGREDGLGIVIVDGLVPGGNAERACNSVSDNGSGEIIMFGDSISSVELVVRRQILGNSEDVVTSVQTECLGYDATVQSLSELFSSLDDDEIQNPSERYVVLVLKRLRRRPKVRVRLMYPPSQKEDDETIELTAGDNLRMAMLQRNVKLNDALARRYDGKSTGSGNCGSSGLCRTCAVSVLRGGELMSPPKINEKQQLEDTPRWRLACKSYVGYGMEEGEIVIQVNPRQW